MFYPARNVTGHLLVFQRLAQCLDLAALDAAAFMSSSVMLLVKKKEDKSFARLRTPPVPYSMSAKLVLLEASAAVVSTVHVFFKTSQALAAGVTSCAMRNGQFRVHSFVSSESFPPACKMLFQLRLSQNV